jgi:hypothetical protein
MAAMDLAGGLTGTYTLVRAAAGDSDRIWRRGGVRPVPDGNLPVGGKISAGA